MSIKEKITLQMKFECLTDVNFCESFKNESFSVKKETVKLLLIIDNHTFYFGKKDTNHMLFSLHKVLSNTVSGFKHDFDFVPTFFIKSKKTNAILVTFKYI